jgi:hypothetical protein
LVSEFSSTSVPIFFSEYGCNLVTPRIFTEVQALYGPQMTTVMSGGLVYEYSQEVSNYGLVILNNDGSAQLRADYGNLQSQYKKLNFTLLESQNSTATSITPPACDAKLISSSSFNNSFTLPDIPSGAQDLIDNGISNPNQGKLVPVTTTKVSQTVKDANGNIINGLAIKPLPNDQSNTPGSVTTSGAPGATTTKKAAAGRMQVSNWFLVVASAIGLFMSL